MSVERSNYILAHDHAWLELTVDAPIQGKADCMMVIAINDEPFLSEPLFTTGRPLRIKTGFLFAIPVGPTQIDAQLRGCADHFASLELEVTKDTLLRLRADDKSLVKEGEENYVRETLEGVAERLEQLHQTHAKDRQALERQLASQSRLLLGGFVAVLLIMAIALLLWWRGNRRNTGQPAGSV